jgi:ubiquinone/menaquinone biosynthesis C-methylase UbiE
MTEHAEIYQNHSEDYDPLIEHEDYQGNLLKGLLRVTAWDGKDIVETGAGTGRFTCLLAPIVRSIRAFDREAAMVEVARNKIIRLGTKNWELGTADHRSLPVQDHSADIVISGWSVCYLAAWDPQGWRPEVKKTLAEMTRILRPGGWIILVETQGTGFTEPNPPEHLKGYFEYLKENGFTLNWIRTDYRFDSFQQAEKHCRFFFGDALADQVVASNSPILPECTGIWSKQLA